MDFMLSSKAFDGDDGMEDDVPPAETTLTERSVGSLSWELNVDRIPIREVEGVDEPLAGADIELGDKDGRDEGMKLKNVAVVQERWE